MRIASSCSTCMLSWLLSVSLLATVTAAENLCTYDKINTDITQSWINTMSHNSIVEQM